MVFNMSKKDYTNWHKKKTEIEHTSDVRIFFHEREVWWCSMGSNVGFEQDGKGTEFARPVFVFKKFNKEVFWAIPISTKIKTTKFYTQININDGIDRVAIISQLRLTDAKRLIDKIGVVNEENYKDIQKAVISLCNS